MNQDLMNHLADCIEKGIAEHPNWKQTNRALFRLADDTSIFASEWKHYSDQIVAACSMGFALAGGWANTYSVDYDKADLSECVVMVNDELAWNLVQVTAALRSGTICEAQVD